MFMRTLIWAAALCGGFSVAQFPEYAQQYTQRLGGAVDALAVVVADFDASAATVGLTREQALVQLQGTAFLERRRQDMTRSIMRYDRLAADLDAIERMGPFMRAYHATHMMDTQIARGTWASFRPAVPITLAGLLFAAMGFLATFTALSSAAMALRPRRRAQSA